jgi:hypothetical protein
MKCWEAIGFVGKMQGVSGFGGVGTCHGVRAIIAWHEFYSLPRMCLHIFTCLCSIERNTLSSTSNLTLSPQVDICKFCLGNFSYEQVVLCLIDIQGQTVNVIYNNFSIRELDDDCGCNV